MYIQLSTIREVSVDTYEAIPYETKEVKTDSLYIGEKKVVTAGVDGVKTTTTTTKTLPCYKIITCSWRWTTQILVLVGLL